MSVVTTRLNKVYENLLDVVNKYKTEPLGKFRQMEALLNSANPINEQEVNLAKTLTFLAGCDQFKLVKLLIDLRLKSWLLLINPLTCAIAMGVTPFLHVGKNGDGTYIITKKYKYNQTRNHRTLNQVVDAPAEPVKISDLVAAAEVVADAKEGDDKKSWGEQCEKS